MLSATPCLRTMDSNRVQDAISFLLSPFACVYFGWRLDCLQKSMPNNSKIRGVRLI